MRINNVKYTHELFYAGEKIYQSVLVGMKVDFNMGPEDELEGTIFLKTDRDLTREEIKEQIIEFLSKEVAL